MIEKWSSGFVVNKKVVARGRRKGNFPILHIPGHHISSVDMICRVPSPIFSQICLLARLLMSSLSTTPMSTPFVRVSPNSLHTSGSVAVQRSAMRSSIIRRAVTRESFITLLSMSSSVLGLYYSANDRVRPTDHR